jgi:hypothetical protein
MKKKKKIYLALIAALFVVGCSTPVVPPAPPVPIAPSAAPTPVTPAFDLQGCLTQERTVCAKVGAAGSPAYLGCWAIDCHSCYAQAGLPDSCK